MSDEHSALQQRHETNPEVPPHPLDSEWLIESGKQTFGPFSGHKLRDFAREGRMDAQTSVRRTDELSWRTAGSDPLLAKFWEQELPPRPDPNLPESKTISAGDKSTVVHVVNTMTTPARPAVLVEDGPAKPKSPGTALLLSILLCGAGQMYNGQVLKGLLMLFGCLLLWVVLLGWIINLWSWIDAYRTASAMNQRYQRRLAMGLVV